jgi:hypothetical protein
MAVPPGYAVYLRAERWVVDMNPGGRQPRLIELDPTAPPSLVRPRDVDPACPWLGPFHEQLGPDSTLDYFTAVGCGGSGGVEGFLAGHWSLGGQRIVVSCSVQREPVFGGSGPDPAGCLVQLRSACAVPATDTPVRVGPTGSTQPPLILAPPLAGTQSRGAPSE